MPALARTRANALPGVVFRVLVRVVDDPVATVACRERAPLSGTGFLLVATAPVVVLAGLAVPRIGRPREAAS